MSNDKCTKAEVSYVHWEKTDYQCVDCPMWLKDPQNLCVLMGPEDTVDCDDTCNYFTKSIGTPLGFTPLGLLTKDSAGWMDNPMGFSCKRCANWDPEGWKCGRVDENSAGLDFSIIHPDGCCNLWAKDTLRGAMKTEEFYSFSTE